RREVGPAAEPGAVALGQVAEVGVYRRHQRAARVQHERDAGRGEAIALARYLLGELRRHLAENFGEIDASLPEARALDHDARASAPAALALPGVFAKLACPVRLLEPGGDAILQSTEVIDRAAVHVGRDHAISIFRQLFSREGSGSDRARN